ncbi:Kelch repeat-containing protein, partial [Longirhabdus pacifica]|uniref:Kelch repeat-containing protein n=1 Tax=Longirhabdus pacifica TaxID=2305227 RepID=UPI00351F968F
MNNGSKKVFAIILTLAMLVGFIPMQKVEASTPTPIGSAFETIQNEQDLKYERKSLSLEIVGDNMYAVGGFNGKFAFASGTVEALDVSNTPSAWIQVDSMETTRYNHTTAVVGDKIYSMGGNKTSGSDPDSRQSVEVYDSVQDKWTMISEQLNTSRIHAESAVVDDKIYVTGGSSATVEVLDTNNQQDGWKMADSMSYVRASHGIAVVDKKIYVIGGDAKQSMEVFDTQNPSQGWTVIGEDMLNGNWGNIEAVVVGKKIYAVMDTDINSKPVLSLQVYDTTYPELGWITLPHNIKPRTSSSVAEKDGVLYIVGGYKNDPYSANREFLKTVQSLDLNGITDMPQNVNASMTTGQVDLSWDAVQGATGYTIKRSTQPEGPYTLVAQTLTELTYQDQSVNPGTTYYYTITAYNGKGEGIRSRVMQASEQLVSPVLYAQSEIEAVKLNWNTVTNATYYNVKRSDVQGGSYATVTTTTYDYYDDIAVTAGDTYYYVVTAVNAVEESANSNEVVATPQSAQQKPQAPTGLQAMAGDGEVELNWNSVNDATSYKVKRATTQGGSYVEITATSAASYKDTSVSNGTTYYYVVTAENAAGESGASNESTATPQAPQQKPQAPTGLQAMAGDGEVELNWNSVNDATSYKVKRATTQGGSYVEITATSAASYKDTSVSNGTTYYYVVTAVNAAGESGTSTESTATPQAPQQKPQAPTGLQTVAGDGEVELNWNSVNDATSYKVKRSETQGGSYVEIATTTAASYTDTSVSNGTTYYYVVTAVNAAGESGASSESTATPQGTTQNPLKPQITNATWDANQSEVVINWNTIT